MSSQFALAKSCTTHLIVQPSDLALNPPESYLFIQDFLIISCGVLYALCYLFYMFRTYRDKKVAGNIQFLCLTMGYEIFYAFTTTSTAFELASFMAWFLLDILFAAVAILTCYTASQRTAVITRMACGFLLTVGVLKALTIVWPDERDQITAYWTGLILQFPIGWVSLWLLIKERDARGHSLEIWITRYLGCYTAYGVFIWRYLNLPENWSYVGSGWSWWIIGLTLLPETIYPFGYVWVVYRKEKKKVT